METYAEQAAFVVCLGEKALAECPLDPNLLEEKLHQGFANSEMSLMLGDSERAKLERSCIHPAVFANSWPKCDLIAITGRWLKFRPFMT